MRPILTAVLLTSIATLSIASDVQAQSPASPAPAAAAPEEAEGEVVEAAEEVEAVEAVEPEAEAEGPLGAAEIISRLHPAVVHMPIGWLIMVLLLDAAALTLRRERWLEVSFWVLVGTVLAFFPAIVTGLMRFDHLPDDPETQAPALIHRNLMFMAHGLAVAALVLRLRTKNRLVGATKVAYLLMLATANLLVTVGGHLGGELVYGDDYLPF